MEAIFVLDANDNLKQVIFRGWTENRGRQANIELAILKRIGCAHFDNNLERVIMSPVLLRDEPFKFSEEKKIRETLTGFCIEPKIERVW